MTAGGVNPVSALEPVHSGVHDLEFATAGERVAYHASLEENTSIRHGLYRQAGNLLHQAGDDLQDRAEDPLFAGAALAYYVRAALYYDLARAYEDAIMAWECAIRLSVCLKQRARYYKKLAEAHAYLDNHDVAASNRRLAVNTILESGELTYERALEISYILLQNVSRNCRPVAWSPLIADDFRQIMRYVKMYPALRADLHIPDFEKIYPQLRELGE